MPIKQFLISSFLCAAPFLAAAEPGDETCFPLFQAAGAVPGTSSCELTAATANVGLGSFFCTGSGDYIQRYCQAAPCPVEPLNPITDPDAIAIENGNPVNIRGLTDETTTKLRCLRQAVRDAGGTFTVTSAYRPQAYQDHFYEIFTKKRQLEKLIKKFPQCQAIKNQVDAENQKHGLQDKVGKTSNHTPGKAFDARWRGITTAAVDSAAEACGLSRPFKKDDPVHFQ